MQHETGRERITHTDLLLISTDSGSPVLRCFKREGQSEFQLFRTEGDHCADTLETARAYLAAINAGRVAV